MEYIPNITPGEILFEEFLKPMNISANRLSKDTMIPTTIISEIIKGRKKITADTAIRLGIYFSNTPEFWLGIQNEFDLRNEG